MWCISTNICDSYRHRHFTLKYDEQDDLFSWDIKDLLLPIATGQAIYLCFTRGTKIREAAKTYWCMIMNIRIFYSRGITTQMWVNQASFKELDSEARLQTHHLDSGLNLPYCRHSSHTLNRRLGTGQPAHACQIILCHADDVIKTYVWLYMCRALCKHRVQSMNIRQDQQGEGAAWPNPISAPPHYMKCELLDF